jgi:hypothetical protein
MTGDALTISWLRLPPWANATSDSLIRAQQRLLVASGRRRLIGPYYEVRRHMDLVAVHKPVAGAFVPGPPTDPTERSLDWRWT